MIKRITFALIAIMFSSNVAKSQCLTGIMDATINVTPVYQTTPVPGGSPSYFQFTGIAGALYYFTYCFGGGNYSGDPYLTVANNIPTALVWNDDNCGLGSNLTWNCPANGIYRVYTSGCCPCGFKSAGSNLAFKYDLPPCSGIPPGSNVLANPVSLCAGSTSTLTLTTNYAAPGFVFQWQSAPTGLGPFTNIGGATTATYSGIMNSTLFYQCVITCTPSAQSMTSNTVMVTVNPSPTVSIGGPNAICFGQNVGLTANGALTYTWNNGSQIPNQTYTPAVTTTYSLIGMAGGCTGTALVTVTVNPNPTVTIAGNNTVCAGTPLNLTASGATSYTWSTGDLTSTIAPTPGANITYTVFGSDPTGCSGFATHAVTVNAVPNVTVTGPNSMCLGQTITLNAFGANTYTWNPGAVPTASIADSPTTTTSYSVVGSSPLGCPSAPVIKIINVNPKPNVIISVCTPTICKGEVCTFTASGVDTYSWNTGALTSTIVVSPSTTTNYTVTGTNTTTGCFNTTTVQLVVSLCTGLDNADITIGEISLHPNPNNGEFVVELNNGLTKNIEVSDMMGRVILNTSSEFGKIPVNLNKFANGIYYVKIQSNNTSTVVKIVKQ